MNKIKNFLANLPIYPGLFLRHISDILFVFSFNLHIAFNTEAGKKIQQLDNTLKKLKDSLEQKSIFQENQNATKTPDRYNKLATIIKGSNNG